MKRFTVIVLAAGLGLAGCGTTPEERGLSGMGIGAGAGALLGAITGMGPLTGTVVGAAAGGLTGVLTGPNQVYLGEPVWKRRSSGWHAQAAPQRSSRTAAPRSSGTGPTVAATNSTSKRTTTYQTNRYSAGASESW